MQTRFLNYGLAENYLPQAKTGIIKVFKMQTSTRDNGAALLIVYS